MKQKISKDDMNRENADVWILAFVICGLFAVTVYGALKQREEFQTEAKHENVTTEIPVQRIRCVKPGHNFCLEYRVFNEVRQ